MSLLLPGNEAFAYLSTSTGSSSATLTRDVVAQVRVVLRGCFCKPELVLRAGGYCFSLFISLHHPPCLPFFTSFPTSLTHSRRELC